ncbi:hypothetical protein FRC11_013049 [Ceratobasidium sp. 423]|nr:hypothetical protein FRC11_013049 [Ceratobasidium sp. 423]
MDGASPSNVTTSRRAPGQTSAQNDGTYPNNPMTTASSSPVPSRIPQPTRPSKDRAARQKVPGYAAPTAASSQRQLPKIRPERLASRSSAGIALSNPATRHVAEGFVSKIPTWSKTRAEIESSGSTLRTTPARSPQSSVQPTPTLPLAFHSPPPQYAERSETPVPSHPENLPPPMSRSSPRSPPPYCRHASELELEIYVPPYANEDESEDVIACLLESLSNSLPASWVIRRFKFEPVLRHQYPTIETSPIERWRSSMSELHTRRLPHPIESDSQIVTQECRTDPSLNNDSSGLGSIDCWKCFYSGSSGGDEGTGERDELQSSIIDDWLGNPDTAALFANLGIEV